MNFKEVAQVFNHIELESSRTEITKMLAGLLKAASPEEASIIVNLSLGLLRAPYKGTQFNVAEKSMTSIVAHFLDKSVEDIQGASKQAGDLGSVIALGDWPATQQEFSVLAVYQKLCDIEAIEGNRSQELKSEKMRELLQGLDPLSAKMIIRIVLGKLRLGFSDMTIVDALSWMETGNKTLRKKIEEAYNNCADIGIVASTLKSEGIQAIEHMKIYVGTPIRPAAAERLPTAQAIFDKLGTCIAQPKLDGFRLQIHVEKRAGKTEIHFFSRNLIDMSPMFPDLVAALEGLQVETLICEGEAIVVDPNTGTFLPFQETVKRKRKHDIESVAIEFPLRVYLFDILYLNGQSLLDNTQAERRKKLEAVIATYQDDRVQVLEERIMHSGQDIETYFAENVSAGLEGLVLKKADSVYEAGKRNFNWIKFKRQEEGHLEDTLDCVILGYYAGKGKRATFGIGAFLVGVYHRADDTFQTVAKIGTGLKDDEWKELKQKLDAIAVHDKPHNVHCAKELYPDVWVYPELVCQIRADEITRSPLHTAGKTSHELGFALRFPRFMGYRFDKSAGETTTQKELKGLFADQYERARSKKN